MLQTILSCHPHQYSICLCFVLLSANLTQYDIRLVTEELQSRRLATRTVDIQRCLEAENSTCKNNLFYSECLC